MTPTSSMKRIWTDFNARTPEGLCWILVHDDKGLETHEAFAALGLKLGDTIVLYQDDDDFAVVAVLDRRFVQIIEREAWVAIPDWSTLRRK